MAGNSTVQGHERVFVQSAEEARRVRRDWKFEIFRVSWDGSEATLGHCHLSCSSHVLMPHQTQACTNITHSRIVVFQLVGPCLTRPIPSKLYHWIKCFKMFMIFPVQMPDSIIHIPIFKSIFEYLANLKIRFCFRIVCNVSSEGQVFFFFRQRVTLGIH